MKQEDLVRDSCPLKLFLVVRAPPSSADTERLADGPVVVG